MDSERQIRFLIAPFLFFGSLLFGGLVSESLALSMLQGLEPHTVAALGGAIAASILPVGFVIGTISIALLRAVFGLRKRTYEISFSAETLSRVRRLLDVPVGSRSGWSEELYTGVTFDHELLSKGVHGWVVRRWSAFNVSVHSCVALALSHVIAPLFSIQQSWLWSLCSLTVGSLLAWNGVVAWLHTMRMLEFQSRRLFGANSKDAANIARTANTST